MSTPLTPAEQTLLNRIFGGAIMCGMAIVFGTLTVAGFLWRWWAGSAMVGVDLVVSATVLMAGHAYGERQRAEQKAKAVAQLTELGAAIKAKMEQRGPPRQAGQVQ